MAYREEIPVWEVRRRRRLNGLPLRASRTATLPKFWRRPLVWVGLGVVAIYALCLYAQWLTFKPRLVQGHYAGLTPESIQIAAKFALPTVLGWCVIYVIVDRWRPQRFWIALFALGWGACVATTASLFINSWASQMMGAQDENSAVGAATGIYIAPFVEEATKASVLFLVAILVRNRLTSKLSTITLAGLSAAGFAFTENIIYYARAYMYASQTTAAGDRMEALKGLALLRGVLTCWGHPMFTSMTGLGLAVALRSRSKSVRVLAPITGYLAAAFCHMFFNASASKPMDAKQMLMFFGIFGLSFVATALTFVIVTWLQQGRLIRARLTDFVRFGWLPADDPRLWGTWRIRVRMLWLALWNGPTSWRATVMLLRSATELAYLRDAVLRGIVDDTAYWRERELLEEIRALRTRAVADPRGLKRRRLFIKRHAPQHVQLAPAYVGALPGQPVYSQAFPAPAPQQAPSGYAQMMSNRDVPRP